MKNLIKIGAILTASIAAAAGADATFAEKAAQGGMAEVQLGHLAIERASAPAVKKFGQQMIDDHSKAGEQLKSIAAKENITLPTTLDAKDRALIARLSQLTGEGFDKEYMAAMVKDHETDLAEFQKEAKSGSDPEMKSFASSTLPTLREHLSMAKRAAGSVGASAGTR